MSKRIEFSVSDELFARLESARGDIPRARFGVRAIEKLVEALEAPRSNPTGVMTSVKVSPSGPSLRDTWAR